MPWTARENSARWMGNQQSRFAPPLSGGWGNSKSLISPRHRPCPTAPRARCRAGTRAGSGPRVAPLYGPETAPVVHVTAGAVLCPSRTAEGLRGAARQRAAHDGMTDRPTFLNAQEKIERKPKRHPNRHPVMTGARESRGPHTTMRDRASHVHRTAGTGIRWSLQHSESGLPRTPPARPRRSECPTLTSSARAPRTRSGWPQGS